MTQARTSEYPVGAVTIDPERTADRRRGNGDRAKVDEIVVITHETDTGIKPWEQKAARYVWAITRISLGFVFLWAFADKLLGLGTSTPS